MAGTLVSVGLAGVAVTIVVAASAVGAAAVVGHRASAAADAAALAAADAASGAIVGVPCERADQVTRSGGGRMMSCGLDGLVATVSVTVSLGAFVVEARARAGPPP